MSQKNRSLLEQSLSHVVPVSSVTDKSIPTKGIALSSVCRLEASKHWSCPSSVSPHFSPIIGESLYHLLVFNLSFPSLYIFLTCTLLEPSFKYTVHHTVCTDECVEMKMMYWTFRLYVGDWPREETVAIYSVSTQHLSFSMWLPFSRLLWYSWHDGLLVIPKVWGLSVLSWFNHTAFKSSFWWNDGRSGFYGICPPRLIISPWEISQTQKSFWRSW